MSKNPEDQPKSIIEKNVKRLYSIFLNTSEFIGKNNEVDLASHEEALLTLIAAIIKADGKADPEEIKLASTFFRNNAPVERANKLLSQLDHILKEESSISLEKAGEILLEKFEEKKQKINLLKALIQYSIDNSPTKEKEEVLLSIGKALDVPQGDTEKIIQEIKNYQHQSQKYGRIGAIISVLVVFIGFILLAGFLRPIFLGLAFAYLMDPILSFFEKKTRFSRSSICIASIVFFIGITILISLKIASSINVQEIKTFTKKAPTQLVEGVSKFRKFLESKNIPKQILDPLDQIIYGPINYTPQTLFTSDKELLNSDNTIDEILKNSIQNADSILQLFPLQEALLNKRGKNKVNSFCDFLNSVIETSDHRIKLISNFKNVLWLDHRISENIFEYDSLEEIKKKIIVRRILSEAYSLTPFLSTQENVTIHGKDFILKGFLNYSPFTKGVLSQFSYFIGLLMDIILAIGFYFFFAKQFYKIGNGILEAIPTAYRYNTDQIFRKINWIFEGYMRGQFSMIFIETITYSIIFYFMGIPYAFLLGLISGVAILIPYVGLLFAFIATFSVAVAGGMPITTALLILLIVFGIINLIENFYLSPKLVGDRVGLSDLETLIAIVAGGSLGGFIGIISAIPAAAILKIFVTMLYARYKDSALYKQTFPSEESEI